MDKYFNPEEWRNIWRSFDRSSSAHEIGIEILRQHVYEKQPDLMTKDSTWYKHFARKPNPYIR